MSLFWRNILSPSLALKVEIVCSPKTYYHPQCHENLKSYILVQNVWTLFLHMFFCMYSIYRATHAVYACSVYHCQLTSIKNIPSVRHKNVAGLLKVSTVLPQNREFLISVVWLVSSVYSCNKEVCISLPSVVARSTRSTETGTFLQNCIYSKG
jgi:hypothetical protein